MDGLNSPITPLTFFNAGANLDWSMPPSCPCADPSALASANTCASSSSSSSSVWATTGSGTCVGTDASDAIDVADVRVAVRDGRRPSFVGVHVSGDDGALSLHCPFFAALSLPALGVVGGDDLGGTTFGGCGLALAEGVEGLCLLLEGLGGGGVDAMFVIGLEVGRDLLGHLVAPRSEAGVVFGVAGGGAAARAEDTMENRVEGGRMSLGDVAADLNSDTSFSNLTLSRGFSGSFSMRSVVTCSRSSGSVNPKTVTRISCRT